MATIRSLIVKIGVDISDLQKNLNNAQKQMQKTAQNLINIGSTLTQSLTLPILAVGGASIKMAMDAVESENLFAVSMGNMAEDARAWSEDLRNSLGLNAYEVRKNVGVLNTMLGSMGLGEDAAYGMSKSLTELVYDMSAFYDLAEEEAFTKLRSGITGESEPLKQLGIIVNDTTIKNYAYTKGIVEQGATLTEGQKILARFGTIMEQTAKAQGDWARTMESPTMQLRIMGNAVKNAAIDLGMALMPAFKKLLEVVAGAIEWIKKSVEWFSNLDDGTKNTIITILAMAAAIGPLLMAFGSMARGLSSIIGLVKIFTMNPIVLAVIAVIGTLAYLYATNEWVRNGIINAWETAVDAVKNKADKYIGYINDVKAALEFLKSINPMTKVREVLRSINDIQWRDFVENSGSGGDASGTVGSSASWGEPAAATKTLAEQVAEWWENAKKEAEDYAKSLAAAFGDLGDTGEDAFDKLASSCRDFISALRQQTSSFANFTGMFDIFERKVSNPQSLFNRMKAQLSAISEWKDALVTIQSKGVSEEFLNQLRGMGPSAVDSIIGLSKMSAAQLMEYQNMYSQKSDIAGTQAEYYNAGTRYADTVIEQQINLEVTGSKEDADVIVERIVRKLRLAGVTI